MGRMQKRHQRANVVSFSGADDETRTRDPHLGKVMRYQLRYIRMYLFNELYQL